VWTFACAGVLGVAQGGDDLVGEPFAKGPVFGAVVVDEEGVDAGLADQQGVFDLVVDQGLRVWYWSGSSFRSMRSLR